MPSRKRLRSVAHNIAHHSLSGLTFGLTDELERASTRYGANCVTVELIQDQPNPEDFPIGRLLPHLAGLKAKLSDILCREGFELAHLSSARLTYHFSVKDTEYGNTICNVVLVDSRGNAYEDWMDFSGRRDFLGKGRERLQRSFCVQANREAMNAPTIYVQKVPRQYGCIIVTLAILAVLVVTCLFATRAL